MTGEVLRLSVNICENSETRSRRTQNERGCLGAHSRSKWVSSTQYYSSVE